MEPELEMSYPQLDKTNSEAARAMEQISENESSK